MREIPAMEVLTSRIESDIGKEKMTLSQEIENLERVLKQADLVNAKSKPLDFEITDDRNKIQKSNLNIR
jgi:hypothetical protein